MEDIMKLITKFTACAATLALMACSAADAPKVDAPAVKEMASKAADVKKMATKTKAVLIYADWCGSCKVLDPKIKKVQAMGEMPGLEFVTLDYTDKNADNFYAQAQAAGVGEAVKTYLAGTVKTGQLLLVDIDDQKVVGKVTKTLDAPQIIAALKDAITAS
jgi:thiol-disulfide isomerase/thioredoxin